MNINSRRGVLTGVIAALGVVMTSVVGCTSAKESTAEADSTTATPIGNPRLVVTGHDADGRGLVVRDERIAPDPKLAADGWQATPLWGFDGVQSFPNDGKESATAPPMPAPGGVRFTELVVYPEGQRPTGTSRGTPDAINKEDATSPMHHTPSEDLVVVLEGQVELELDTGTFVLNQGDYLVQNGTPHAWHNRTDSPARLGVVVVGAEHAGY